MFLLKLKIFLTDNHIRQRKAVILNPGDIQLTFIHEEKKNNKSSL